MSTSQPGSDQPTEDASRDQQDVEKSRILGPLLTGNGHGPSPGAVFLYLVLAFVILAGLLGLAIWWISSWFLAR